MPTELTNQDFAKLLAVSGLMSPEQVSTTVEAHRGKKASELAEFLVAQGTITEWQSRKLLLGKHRGFQLGGFQLRSHLARGGMSTLYVAREEATGTDRALKVLPPAKAGEASYLPRFMREARLASELNHGNIMRVLDVVCHHDHGQDVNFMVMELLHGRDLFNEVSERGPLPALEAAEIFRQAAVGLQYAHDRGLVHRDVKPGNLFLTVDGVVKIVDLGLAAITEDQVENLTREYNERVLGTADYLAPEQAGDSHTVDSRADIYGLGCTLYFVLTGRPPFTDGNLAQRILAHQTKEPQDVAEIRDDVPESLLALLSEMLTKSRDQRIQSCEEIAARLTRIIADPGPRALRHPTDVSCVDQPIASDTPTDSIRAADTSVDPDTHLRPGPATPYCREFEAFLLGLDQQSGILDVMNSDFRNDQRRQMSEQFEESQSDSDS